MKPYVPALVVCTATGNLAEALPRIARWQALASFDWPLVIVENGGVTDLRPAEGTFVVERRAEWLGSVPAMALAMDCARQQYGKDALAAAHPGAILIDDDPTTHRHGWQKAGGTFIHHLGAEYTIAQLRQLGVN